ncbi:hypothetical protein BJ322DRAFT_1067878 [Thelephora terrestris]|uniref:Uncharacterized protein n=1 Tax=Thelephora terrestris TaxID=56493 RepID=A0A9P6HCR4_9AGAM|nr:hypothetical protein BJ322DRAFT_1067878 [Thelephora terrestris]
MLFEPFWCLLDLLRWSLDTHYIPAKRPLNGGGRSSNFDFSFSMTRLTPAVFGMWSVCCVLFTAFVIYHLWHYDRFKCLQINRGPYAGAFKRVMTYTYLITLPLITTYSVGNAVIRYKEGFVFSSQYGLIPKPYTEWTQIHRGAIFPLMMLLALCFSSEMITHLEELCFWVFLMNATASSQNWFRSNCFTVWTCGSVIALILVPTVSVVSRNNPSKNEGYTFLVGSSVTLALTLCFAPILFLFPAFLRKLVRQGVDKATLVRLQKYHELNRLRFVFKLLFVVPLVFIGIDGISPHSHPINESMFWTETLGMASAFGCIISSGITLLIFFPRNNESEYESSSLGQLSRLQTSQRKAGQHETMGPYQERNRVVFSSDTSIGSSPNPYAHVTQSANFEANFQAEGRYGPPPRYQAPGIQIIEPDNSGNRTVEVFTPLPSASAAMLRPNRLGANGDVEFGGMQDPPATETWVSNWTSQFRSPLGGFISPLYLLVTCANILQM